MSWNDPDPYANRAGFGAHGYDNAAHSYATASGARAGYPGSHNQHAASLEELYDHPEMNFSQPRVGYDPNDPRSVHSEYYECDPLEGHGPGGPPAGPSFVPYEQPRRLPPTPNQVTQASQAGQVPVGVYADSRLSQSVESHGVYHDAPGWDGDSDEKHYGYYGDERKDSSYSYAPYAVVENYMNPSVASLPLGSKVDVDSGRDLLEPPPLPKRKGFWGRLFSNHVEEKGIERIPESERSSRHLPGLLLLWFSVNLVVSTFPIGVSAARPQQRPQPSP